MDYKIWFRRKNSELKQRFNFKKREVKNFSGCRQTESVNKSV